MIVVAGRDWVKPAHGAEIGQLAAALTRS